jgi:hypothetical protein
METSLSPLRDRRRLSWKRCLGYGRIRGPNLHPHVTAVLFCIAVLRTPPIFSLGLEQLPLPLSLRLLFSITYHSRFYFRRVSAHASLTYLHWVRITWLRAETAYSSSIFHPPVCPTGPQSRRELHEMANDSYAENLLRYSGSSGSLHPHNSPVC